MVRYLTDQASAVAIKDGIVGAARCMRFVGAGDEDVEVGDECGAILFVGPQACIEVTVRRSSEGGALQ
jgi:hypothetical protein